MWDGVDDWGQRILAGYAVSAADFGHENSAADVDEIRVAA